MTRNVKVLGAAAAFTVAVLSPLAAQAAKTTKPVKQTVKPSHAALVVGVLTSPSAGGATITDPAGTAHTVTFTATTHFVAVGEAAAAQGLFANDQAAVYGMLSGTTFTATTVEYAPGAFAFRNVGISGAVQTTGTNSVTVMSFQGRSFAVQIASDATYFVNGKKVTTAPQLTSNEAIAIHADETTAGTYIAHAVYVAGA